MTKAKAILERIETIDAKGGEILAACAELMAEALNRSPEVSEAKVTEIKNALYEASVEGASTNGKKLDNWIVSRMGEMMSDFIADFRARQLQ